MIYILWFIFGFSIFLVVALILGLLCLSEFIRLIKRMEREITTLEMQMNDVSGRVGTANQRTNDAFGFKTPYKDYEKSAFTYLGELETRVLKLEKKKK